MDTVTGGYNTVETCCDGTSAENYQDAQNRSGVRGAVSERSSERILVT